MDNNEKIKNLSFSHENNLLCSDQRTVLNDEEYCAEFFEKFDLLEFDKVDEFFKGPPLRVEFKMYTETQQLTGKHGRSGESLNGLLCKAAFERVIEKTPKTSYRICFVTEKTRGPLEFLVRTSEERAKNLDLTVLAFDKGIENYLGALPNTVLVNYKVFSNFTFSIPPGQFDFIYIHLSVPKLHESGFLSKLLLKLEPKGILAGTKPNPSRISATSGRSYLGINDYGAAVSAQSGRTFVDSNVSYHELDPRLFIGPIAEIGQHPFFTGMSNYVTQPSQDLNTGVDGIYFENDMPVRVEIYNDEDCFSLGPGMGKYLFNDFEDKKLKNFNIDPFFKKAMDSPVPASLQTLVSAGTVFLVKEKQDGTPLLMCSSFSGQDIVVFYFGSSYLVAGDAGVFKNRRFFLSQWERLESGALSFSRPSGLFLGGILQPYNFVQQLRFFTPRFLKIFVSTCSGLDSLVVEEGYVLTSPNSMLVNYSFSMIGASLHVKRDQTLDILDEEKKVIEINLSQGGRKVRSRPDKKNPNTEKQLTRILNSVTVDLFLKIAPILGSIYPAAHQISTIKEIIDLCDQVREETIDRKEGFLSILKKDKKVVDFELFQPFEDGDYNLELEVSDSDDGY